MIICSGCMVLASLNVVVEFMASTINTIARGQTVQVQQSVLLAMVVILHTTCMGSLERLTLQAIPHACIVQYIMSPHSSAAIVVVVFKLL